MAGAMHRVAYYLGLVQEDPAADDYDDVPMKPRPSSSSSSSSTRSTRSSSSYEPEITTTRRTSTRAEVPAVSVMTEETAMWEAPVSTPDASYSRITTLHPRFYNDARRIGEEFRTGVPVIMNLTDMDDADAKRIVDFAAGLVFGLHGTIERVTSKVFLLSPANVDVGAEARAQLQQGGFFNQS